MPSDCNDPKSKHESQHASNKISYPKRTIDSSSSRLPSYLRPTTSSRRRQRENSTYNKYNSTGKSSGYTSLTRQDTYVIDSCQMSTPQQAMNDIEDDLYRFQIGIRQSKPKNSVNSFTRSVDKLDDYDVKQIQTHSQQEQLPTNQKKTVDSSTMTELTIDNIVTKFELDHMVEAARTQVIPSNSSTSPGSTEDITRRIESLSQECQEFTQAEDCTHHSDRRSSSISPQNSTDFYEDARSDDESCGLSSNLESNRLANESKSSTSSPNYVESLTHRVKEDHNCNVKDNISVETCNEDQNLVKTYSLGSSYQDPSEFEYIQFYQLNNPKETSYYADKIPYQFREAVMQLDSFFANQSDFISALYMNLLHTIRQEWFEVVGKKESSLAKTNLYVEFFSTFNKKILSLIVNLSDDAGNTAAHYAASNFRLDLIEVMINTGACDVDCMNKAGYTPMMLIALVEIPMNSADVNRAKRIFRIGNVNIKSRPSGQTALMLASSHGRSNTVKLLIECGSDPSLADYDGSTALMCASEMGHFGIVQRLLNQSLTDPHAIDNDGLDALTIAMNNGHKRIASLLHTMLGSGNRISIPSRYRNSGSSWPNDRDKIHHQNNELLRQPARYISSRISAGTRTPTYSRYVTTRLR